MVAAQQTETRKSKANGKADVPPQTLSKRGRKQLERRTALTREPSFRPIDEQTDMKWLWAAYRKGAFDLPEGLDLDTFRVQIREHLDGVPEIFVLEASRPAGLVLGLPGPGGYELTPWAIWFPWASSRERLETALKFLNTMRKQRMLVFRVPREDSTFYEHLKRFRVIRKIGQVIDVPYPGTRMDLYQTVRPQDNG